MANRTGEAVLIFVLPHKFQRKRLEDMKKAMQKKQIPFSNCLTTSVTHIVTEYESFEQFNRQIIKEGYQIPEAAVIVSTKWLIECLKSSAVVPVLSSHFLVKVNDTASSDYDNKTTEIVTNSEWACQRGAKLDHCNKRLTDAIEILQEHAELRDGNQDYSRALAFRRASCVLKTLPSTVQNPHQLDGLKDIGGHVKRVIMEILDFGSSTEVESIRKSAWFKKMKLFTSVFGIGPSTAKNWIDRGWETVKDVREAGCPSADWRVKWGLAFHEDLTDPVLCQEAEIFTRLVQSEADKIAPGAIVTLTGGFRRGKRSGHDVDILISHPTEGQEAGMLAKLLSALESKNLVLVGHKEKSSFRSEILYQDFKLSARGQLDHFEKWLGICKFPKSWRTMAASEIDSKSVGKKLTEEASTAAVDRHVVSSKKKMGMHNAEGSTSDRDLSGTETSKQPGEYQNTNTKLLKATAHSLDESLDETYEPKLKKSRMDDGAERQLDVIASSERDWLARRVDLIISPFSQYYYALVGWTGSKHFNRDARLYAQKVLSLKLTSHGLFDMKKQEPIPAASEEEVFSHLHLPYRDPTDRNC